MLFVNLVNQDFLNNNTATKDNSATNINCQLFFKPIKNKKYFKIYKTCIFIVKNVNNTVSKKLVLISKNKIKGKLKCPICLTERIFIDKIEDEYDLES